MDDRIRKWLMDIQTAIDEINFFLDTETMGFHQYQSNLLLKRAVERSLEIIGEAVNRIVKYDLSYQDKIENSMKIIGLRNQIIHSYDNISDENVWSILISHLPTLDKNVKQLLKSNP